VTIVVMGPAGAGKTTVGKALGGELGCLFLDADDFHSPESIEHMRKGQSLTDADREPWLARIRHAIDQERDRGRSVVVACSALKQRYRELLTGSLPDTRWVYLQAPAALLEARLAERQGHFAGPSNRPRVSLKYRPRYPCGISSIESAPGCDVSQR
jgi:gluconokinase